MKLRLGCILLLIGTGSCAAQQPDRPLNGQSPFGVWQTQSGLFLVVTRDRRYVICDPVGCDNGRLEPEIMRSGANLLGFWSLPVGRRLEERMRGSGWWVDAGDADLFQLSTGKIPESAEARLCPDGPCVLLGSIEERDPERFTKLTDY